MITVLIREEIVRQSGTREIALGPGRLSEATAGDWKDCHHAVVRENVGVSERLLSVGHGKMCCRQMSKHRADPVMRSSEGGMAKDDLIAEETLRA